MKTQELLSQSLSNGVFLLEMHLQDMSDADLARRPCPNANSGLWQLGHLAQAETRFGQLLVPGTPAAPPLPEQFNKESAAEADQTKLGTKEQLLAAFRIARNKNAELVRQLSDEQIDAPAPENIRRMAPTVGAVAALMIGHVAMHVGQIQVLRRVLGKSVLF